MRVLRPLIVLLVTLLALLVARAVLVPERLPAAERGRRLAERTGCFTCHGPGGLRGAANPGRSDRTVPGFEGDVMMFAKSDDDVREWIRDGVPRSRAASQTWQRARERGALRMPAFGKRLTGSGISDLVAFVNASAGTPAPESSLAARGLERADALGCVGCHGAGGRFAPRNPGSFKGYIPAWDGQDFAELVRDSVEFSQWVERGTSQRFDRNPIARGFLRRAAVHMPAYERHLQPGDGAALWAYVQWLRHTPH